MPVRVAAAPALAGFLVLAAAAAAAAGGCCYVRGLEPSMPPEPVYAPIWQPRLSLAEKAAHHEALFRAHNWTPEGIVDYRRPKAGRGPDEPRYGWHADGPFFAGIALGTFSLKYEATRDRRALADVSRALAGLELLEGVTGKPGLLARYASPGPPPPAPRRPLKHLRRGAPPYEGWIWRGDVSKDQYAGVSFGIGTCLAAVDDPGIRARAAALAGRIAAALRRDNERIVDTTGEETRFGDLDPFYGPVRIALHAAIVLGIAGAAAEGGGAAAEEYRRELVERGFACAVERGFFNISVLTIRNHVNDNLAFLSLYPLVRLERDPERLRAYRRGLEAAWSEIAHEKNPFFNFVYAACGGERAAEAARDAVAALRLFPDEKIALPVDWTRRPDLDLGRRFFNTRKCVPRAAEPLPLNMRVIGTMMWVSDPDALQGNRGARADEWIAPLDYLEAYWLGRAHGFIRPED